MIKNDFKEISLNGRVAFGIRCFENLILESKTDKNNWKIVLKKFWQFTSIEYLDDWSLMISEILPENLLEFQDYEKHDYEFTNEEEFVYLYKFYQNIDSKINEMIWLVFELGRSHLYGEIAGYGKESLECIEVIVKFMKINQIPLPEIEEFKKYSIKENRGFGINFNGEKLSKILS